MDQGLKERLVGAAVLVAIGVWLIPWVLDGPENPVDSGASSLQLPAAEEPTPMRTQTLRLGGPAEDPPAESTAATADVTAENDTPAPVAVAAEPAPTAPAPPPAAPEPRPVAPAPVVVAAPPAAAPAVAAPAAVAPKGDWVVQLGSFGEEANARRLVDRVKTFGYQAQVSSYRSNGRTLYRVRVGPLASRSQADATASALSAHGVVAQVVTAD